MHLARTTTPDPRALAGNIHRYYAYSFLSSFQLWIAIWVLYLQVERGLSLTQITVLDAPFWLMVVLSEVPTGALADRWGRKYSLMLGAWCFAVGIFMFGVATSYPVLVLSYLLWSLSMTLISGADTAFVYDSLAALGREGEFRRVLGRAQALTTFGFLLGALAGAPLGEATNLAVPIVVSAGVAAVAALIVVTFREPPRSDHSKHLPYLHIMRDAAKYTFRHRGLRATVLLRALLLSTDLWAVIFIQPFLASHDVPVSRYGVLGAAIRVLSIGGALIAYRLARRLGERGLVYALACGFVGSMFVLAAVPSVLAFAAFAVIGFCRAVAGPTFSDYLNRNSPQHLRATVVSFAQVVFSIFVGVTEPLMGAIADRTSLRTAFFVGAMTLALIGGSSLFAWTLAVRAEDREALAVSSVIPDHEGEAAPAART